MVLNGFHNIMTVSTEAKAFSNTESSFCESGFDDLLASFVSVPDSEAFPLNFSEARSFTGLGQEFNSVINSLVSSVAENTKQKEFHIMSYLGFKDIQGGNAQKVLLSITKALAENVDENLNDLQVNSAGLDVLAEILAEAGFDKEKISAFISEKKQNMTDMQPPVIPLQGLMISLGEFLEENNSKEKLDVSALPYIQTALEGFGISREDVTRITDSASDNNGGIDIAKLITLLAPYQEATPGMGGGVGTGENSNAYYNNSSSNSDIRDFLESAVKGEVTLEQFVSKLDSINRNQETKGNSKRNFADAFTRNLYTVKKTQVKEGSSTVMSAEITNSDTSSFRFDTKKPLVSMYSENDNKLFNDRFKNPATDSTMTPLKGVDYRALKSDSGAENINNKSNTEFENYLIGGKAANKEKHGIVKNSSGEANPSIRFLSGAGLYSKATEITHAGQSEKTLPAYVTDQVARQIYKAVRNGDSELRFHIRPPEMGRVELSIATTANGLKISILTEHSTTRDVLINQTNDLKTILADQGIRVEKMDVGLSGNHGHNMAQTRHDSNQNDKGQRRKDRQLFTLDPAEEKKQQVFSNLKIGSAGHIRGKINLVA